jgi:hypothetical protein
VANLLKPSVDQIVFGHSSPAQRRRRSNRTSNERCNAGFLAQDEAAEPAASKLAGLFRAVATVIVLVTGFASAGRI